MRNQKHHEQEECAKILREEYENKEKEKVMKLEEEEKRKQRVADMQKQRRLMKEKEKEKKELEKPKPKPRQYNPPSVSSSNKPKPTGSGRALPDYYNSSSSSKPSGVSGRTRSKKTEVKKPSESYNPSYRSNRNKPVKKEEEKENKYTNPKPVSHARIDKMVKPNKFSSHDASMQDANVMDEIPAELLNQIYSDDMDHHEVQQFQEKEYSDVSEPSRSHMPSSEKDAERLIGGPEDMDVDFRAPAKVEARRRIASPPPSGLNPPSSDPVESENELLQKAIAESLKQGNEHPFAHMRSHPMGKKIPIKFFCNRLTQNR